MSFLRLASVWWMKFCLSPGRTHQNLRSSSGRDTNRRWDQRRGPDLVLFWARLGGTSGSNPSPETLRGWKELGSFSCPGLDRTGPPPAAPPLGPDCENTGPLCPTPPPWPGSVGGSWREKGGRRIDLHVWSWERSDLTAAGSGSDWTQTFLKKRRDQIQHQPLPVQ